MLYGSRRSEMAFNLEHVSAAGAEARRASSLRSQGMARITMAAGRWPLSSARQWRTMAFTSSKAKSYEDVESIELKR